MLQLSSATVAKVETMADKGLKIILHTRELPPEEMVALIMAKQEGTEGVKIENPETDELKSPSQRLRGVLYRVWEITTRQTDFETFYRQKMEYLINHFKSQLP